MKKKYIFLTNAKGLQRHGYAIESVMILNDVSGYTSCLNGELMCLIQTSLKFSIEFSRIHPTCNVYFGKKLKAKKTSNLERNSKLKEKTQGKNSRKKLKVSANPFGRVAENRSNF